MTVRELAEGIAPGTYRIGFFNTDTQRDDETEFTADNAEELHKLFSDFCEENNCAEDTVLYIEENENPE